MSLFGLRLRFIRFGGCLFGEVLGLGLAFDGGFVGLGGVVLRFDGVVGLDRADTADRFGLVALGGELLCFFNAIGRHARYICAEILGVLGFGFLCRRFGFIGRIDLGG